MEQTAVAAAMSHSKRTQELSFKKDAVEGYRVMEGIQREEREGSRAGRARVQFSEDETAMIEDYFAQHISCNKAPSTEECRDFLQQHQLQCSATKIRDKVCNLIGH